MIMTMIILLLRYIALRGLLMSYVHTDSHADNKKENIHCLFLTYSKCKLTGTNPFFIYY